MEEILKEILSKVNNLTDDIKEVKTDISTLKSDVSTLKGDVSELKIGQDNLAKKLDTVIDQTAMLTEFKTEVNEKLDELKADIEFVTHREIQSEKDIYKIKTKLELVK